MEISKLFCRAPVYKFFRFDLPIIFDYPAGFFSDYQGHLHI